MKVIFLVLIGCFLFLEVPAQKLTKAQKKEYKKRGNELRKEFKEKYNSPEKFVELKKDKYESKKRVDSLKIEIARLKEEENQSKEKLELLRTETETEKEKLARIGKTVSQARKKGIPSPGTFYAVQISTLSPQDLAKILDKTQADLNVDIDEKGNDIFILGWYENIQLAQELQKNIRMMGIKLSSVATFKDGKLLKAK